MAKNFSSDEKKILLFFQEYNARFIYKGVEYSVINCAKPTCKKGEPKTDIYVLAESLSNNTQREFKISFKKINADFLENKISADRAMQIFGEDWEQIIENCTNSILKKIKDNKLIYKKKSGRTQKGSITLGWKFELLNKKSGLLSEKIDLTTDQVIDIYAGTNLSADKKDASINGISVSNSGVANFILYGNENIFGIQDVIDNLIPIQKFAEENPDIFFACKALNYRTFEKKFDGNRPLAIHIKWSVHNNKLHGVLVLNTPLSVCGNQVANSLTTSLEHLSIKDTNDVTDSILNDPSVIYE